MKLKTIVMLAVTSWVCFFGGVLVFVLLARWLLQ